MEYKPMYYPIREQVDELKLCDEDIRKIFEDKDYVMGMPLQAQILKELRKLNAALERSVSVPPPPSDTDANPL